MTSPIHFGDYRSFSPPTIDQNFSAKKSSIYIAETIPDNFQEIEQLFQPPAIPAFERIGRIYARAIHILQEGPLENQKPELLALFKLLGIEETQKKTATWALGLLRALPNLSSSSENEDSSGVYAISNPLDAAESFGFKISEKRAATEILAAKHAHWMRLEEHVISGLYCTLQSAPSVEEDDLELEPIEASSDESSEEEESLVVEQWNGLDRIFLQTPVYAVGLIEPWLRPSQSPDPLLSFAKMLIVALSIGLRDGKEDGFMKDQHILFDLEDCYPIAIDPSFSNLEELKAKGMTATDLPLLDDPRANENLSLEQIASLANIVEKWELIGLSSRLQQEPILYADRIVEKQPPNEIGVDETGTAFILNQGVTHGINRGHKVDVDLQSKILNEQQLVAMTTRMSRLKQFVLKKHENQESFQPLDMVKAVDPFYEFYMNTIQNADRRDSLFRGGSPSGLIGRFTPDSLGLPDALAARLVRFASDSSAPSPPPSPGDMFKPIAKRPQDEVKE